MSPKFPETRNSLLIRIQDKSNSDAWSEFSDIYRPVIYRIARQRGMQEADAQDLSQRVMIRVSDAIGDWKVDAYRARFSTWLNRVIRNAIIDQLRRIKPDAPAGGSTWLRQLSQFPSDERFDSEIQRESRREVFRSAARRIRCEFESKSWHAFWMTTVDGVSPTEAADRLQTSVGAIYTARSRIMSRLKQKVREYD